MPRASTYLLEGYTYHLTHRCHNKSFHLKLARDRDTYRKWLLEGVTRYKVPVYAYTITSNHVHVVVHVDDVESVAQMMHLAAGSTAKQYNVRTDHLASVWEHPYQCTLIKGKEHLFNCIRYIDLNMVRAGTVSHPEKWRWCGHDELTGKRKRYRILDRERMLESLEIDCFDEFAENYKYSVEQKLQQPLTREACWTETLAVGPKSFIKNADQLYSKRHTLYPSKADTPHSEAWCVREDKSS